MSALAEAVPVSEFHGRVGQLHHGEMARMPDGTAVKRLMTEDGRDAWQAGEPSSWDRGGVSWGSSMHRTAEDATKDAIARSARRTDPLSVGGATRLSSWAPLQVGASEVRVQGWTTDGKAIVADPASPASVRTVDPSSVKARARVVGSVLGESLHAEEQAVDWRARERRALLEMDAGEALAELDEVEEMLVAWFVLEAGTNPEPFSTSKTSNWVARKGGLPTYIQHVAHDILENAKSKVKDESSAIAIAISQAKKRAAAGNKQAAAAVAQWDKMKASA